MRGVLTERVKERHKHLKVGMLVENTKGRPGGVLRIRPSLICFRTALGCLSFSGFSYQAYVEYFVNFS